MYLNFFSFVCRLQKLTKKIIRCPVNFCTFSTDNKLKDILFSGFFHNFSRGLDNFFTQVDWYPLTGYLFAEPVYV